MQLPTGTLLQGGKYRIERVLGQGGFGITYLGTQVALNRKVAIKEFFMKEYCNRDSETSHVSVPSEGSKELVGKFRQKFIKEAQNIAALNHPHIIRIYDVFEENGTAYYVMEYWDNGSLSDLVKSRGKLSEEEALKYIRQVADALEYIHERKMNHLDVKPGNILLDEKQNVVLIDFGLSKRYDEEGNQTSSTPVGLSHGYAPLEQYKKGGVGTFSPTTDIYSLGATLYKLLTGETPPEANEVMEEGLPPFPTGISQTTVSAVKAAMQPSRKDRPQSVAEFKKILEVTVEKKEEDIGDDEAEITAVVEEEVMPVPESKNNSASKSKSVRHPQIGCPQNRKRFVWREHHWFTNLAFLSIWLYLLCVEFCAIEWGEIFDFDYPESNAVSFYMWVASFITLHFSILLFQGQKCRWYIPLIVNIHPLAAVFFSLPYGAVLLTLFIKKNGMTGWKLLEENRLGKCKLWNKERHFIVSVIIILVIGITSLSLLGAVSNASTSYSHYNYDMLITLVLIFLYSLYLLLRNAIAWPILTFGGIVLCLFCEEFDGHHDHFPLFLFLCLYAFLATSLFIPKRGKSAWNLMKTTKIISV